MPATKGATKAREATAPKNSFILMDASLSMLSNSKSNRQGGSWKDPQKRNKIVEANKKPKSSRVASTCNEYDACAAWAFERRVRVSKSSCFE